MATVLTVICRIRSVTIKLNQRDRAEFRIVQFSCEGDMCEMLAAWRQTHKVVIFVYGCGYIRYHICGYIRFHILYACISASRYTRKTIDKTMNLWSSSSLHQRQYLSSLSSPSPTHSSRGENTLNVQATGRRVLWIGFADSQKIPVQLHLVDQISIKANSQIAREWKPRARP